MTEEIGFNVTVDDVLQFNAKDGDRLIVTMPESSKDMPSYQLDRYIDDFRRAFAEFLKDKDVEVIVVPYGTKVEVIPDSMFKDKTA